MEINNYIDFENVYNSVVFGRLDDDLKNLNNVEQHIMGTSQKGYNLNINECSMEEMDTIILSFHKDSCEDIIWCVDLLDCEIIKWTRGEEVVEVEEEL